MRFSLSCYLWLLREIFKALVPCNSLLYEQLFCKTVKSLNSCLVHAKSLVRLSTFCTCSWMTLIVDPYV